MKAKCPSSLAPHHCYLSHKSLMILSQIMRVSHDGISLSLSTNAALFDNDDETRKIQTFAWKQS